MKVQRQIAQKGYLSDGFIGKYRRLVKETVIPYQYDILCDRAEDTEKSHVVQNFINAGSALRGEGVGDGFYGMPFQDSDLAKWLEAVAYSLAEFPDEELERKADEIVDIIASAQDEDGYLDTYFTIKDKDKRWTNLMEAHELYCMGHMMEAACAYFESTGKDKLLKIMEAAAEHIYRRFVEGGIEGVPGHPEVELALVRMYRLTGNERCLSLAGKFLNERGQNPDFFKEETDRRSWKIWGLDVEDRDYQQISLPLRKQRDAVGHAVRAVYLYTGMADYASETDDEQLLSVCKTLWRSITERRMYVTGGIGSAYKGEAFTVDYDLPSDTAYAETCASVGLVFFASRMLETEVNGEYADVMEQAFYNTVLAGMQLDGKRFFYVNPLEAIPGNSGVAVTRRHVLTTRPKWYACACCPPNVSRLIASFGKYAYGENADTAFCHLYAAGKVSFENGIKFVCKTRYPYAFTVDYEMERGGKMAIRVPAWSKRFSLTVNGKRLTVSPQKGYIYINASDGDKITLALSDSARYVYASERVPSLTGKVALARGPLVYCFEGVDNGGDVFSLRLTGEAPRAEPFDERTLNGTVVIRVPAERREARKSLYSDEEPKETPYTATAIPYYTWANRGETQMRVWMTSKK